MRRAEPVGPDFDARRSATGRTYRYLVWNAPEPDPLLAPIAWHVRDPLDLGSMRTASDVLLGTHDFRSFCRRRPGTDAAEPIVRRVTRARWSVDEGPEATDARGGAGEGRLLRFDDRGQLLLPPDGPLPGGQPGRGGPGQGERGGPDGAPAGRPPATGCPIRRRPTACAWSRWPTRVTGRADAGPAAGTGPA